ncbi:hypothetical protein [Flavobacterium sp.]|uniref:hypothetical protein n=1 Tax=Flavobacterium sp. TaxID=239 RepID=UPI00286AA165|nr:hypothetical protein [Flavobacterium sp.]
MVKILSCITFILIGCHLFAQEVKIEQDTIQPKKSKKLELNLDIASRYIWRGQSWGGDYVVVQPAINYSITDKLVAGFWATTNFQNDYFYADGNAGKGYQEVDFSLSYEINSFLTVQVWDYYWPSVAKVEGVDNGFFNYGTDGTKTVDANLLFDFSDYKVPLSLTLSTLVAGNDYRYDDEGENPKQNYTTYFEAVYTLEELFQKITFEATTGAVFNNQAKYYAAGDYDQTSLVNVGLEATREFQLTDRISMPLSLNYIHNAATKNTEFFGRNFLVAGITFNYN